MTSQEIIQNINKMNVTDACNAMGCSENWYNFFYAMKQTFTLEEIQALSERECDLLDRLAQSIQDGLY